MTDTKTNPVIMTPTANSNVQVNQKKTNQAKTKSPRSKPTHPRTADMVNAAIKVLQDRNGSSLQAIKKYITTTYKIDAEKQAPFIKKYLKAAVESGNLVQTKGKGAAGSFKLSVRKSEVSKVKKKPTSKSAPLKKAVGVKKLVAKKPVKKAEVKKPLASKATADKEKKKATKGPAAKPPKAKTTAKAKIVTKTPPKKAAAVKKPVIKAKAKKPVKKSITATKKK
ncbi:histone H1-like [Chelonus insularis]|uniref:histone H1-like n=1 Tax=Chelonus insularis TaxID=460826 RepID=UPI00158DEDFE|nr:histone H1-like [Chelonus insularis]